MVVLAPYHDVARRLDVDPGEIFETVASGGPASLRDVVRAFGRRDDIRPDKFGFAVVDTRTAPSTSRRSRCREPRPPDGPSRTRTGTPLRLRPRRTVLRRAVPARHRPQARRRRQRRRAASGPRLRDAAGVRSRG